MQKTYNMDVLWAENKGLVYKIAQQYQGYAELEDLIQEGFLALCETMNTYDETKGAFSTYATIHIKKRFIKYVKQNNQVYLPSWVISLYSKYKKYVDRYQKTFGKKPDRQQALNAIGAGKYLDEILRAEKAFNCKSIYDNPGYTDGEEMTIGDLIPAKVDIEGAVLDKVEHEQLAAILQGMISTLGPDEQKIIKARYMNNLSYSDIQSLYDYKISKSVSLEKQAFRILRKQRNKNRLAQFADELLYNRALHGNLVSFNRTWTSSTEKAAIYDYMQYIKAREK